MDSQDYITIPAERKKGQHLQREERGAIQHLHHQGLSARAIAREIGCSPTTVTNELRRGTPPRKSGKGRTAKRGEAVYKANRQRCRKPHKIARCQSFLDWVTQQYREHKWSLDTCVGYARLLGLFSEKEIVCIRTLYNEVWAGSLSLAVTELPEAVKRKRNKGSKPRENGKSYGKSISERPEIASLRIEEGHWEGDTVVGKKAGKEAVILTLLEKKTENYLAIQIPGKTAAAVNAAMEQLRAEYGEKFSQVFKTITVDNGSEFSDFCTTEQWGTAVYYAHPYTSWEQPQNERHNGLLRAFVPKEVSIENFSPEYIMAAADEKLGYHTPEELFDAFLDRVYAT